MSWMFLVVCVALCAFAVVIGVRIMRFRPASRASGRPPVLGDDSLTNPANPLYPLHQPSAVPNAPSPPTFDSTPSSSPSFDSGSGSSPSFDSGSSSSSSGSGGSGCG